MLSDDDLALLMDCAKSALRDDREANAAELLPVFLTHRPEDPAAWILYSDSLYLMGRLKEAKRAIHQALKLGCSRNGHIAKRLAVIYENRGMRRQAEIWFARATRVAESKEDDYLWIMRGGNLAVMGLHGRAIACHRRAIELCGSNRDEAFVNLGLVLRADRQYSAAIASFQSALEINPDYPEALAGLHSLAGIDETLDRVENLRQKQSGGE